MTASDVYVFRIIFRIQYIIHIIHFTMYSEYTIHSHSLSLSLLYIFRH